MADTVTAVVMSNTYGFTTAYRQPATMTSPLGPTPCPSTLWSTSPMTRLDHRPGLPLTLEIYGDGTTLLGAEDITVIVPASL